MANNCLQRQSDGQVAESVKRQIKLLCLPTKAKKINAGRSRHVLLMAARVEAVTQAGMMTNL